MIVNYERVQYRESKSGKCVCGKRISRSRTFEQTINPFNRNKKGDVKTWGEIQKELAAEAAGWKKKPVYHSWAGREGNHVVISCGSEVLAEDYN